LAKFSPRSLTESRQPDKFNKILTFINLAAQNRKNPVTKNSVLWLDSKFAVGSTVRDGALLSCSGAQCVAQILNPIAEVIWLRRKLLVI
jgi:hypothetical protein